MLRRYAASLLVFAVAASFTGSVFAQDTGTTNDYSSKVDELKQNISDRQDEIKQLENEIADYKTRLTNVGNQKATLQNAVKTLDLSRAKLATDIKLTQVKIADANDSIGALSDNIDIKQQEIDKNKEAIANMIHQIDQAEQSSLPEVMLANASISDFLQDIDDMERLQSSISDHIKSLQNLKTDLGKQKTSFEAEKKHLLSLNSQLSDQKELADQQRKEQNQLLSETKDQEANYKKLLADKEARKKQFEHEVDDFEAQLKAVIDPNSFPAPGTKVLAYPLDDVYITQKFGKTVDSVRLYTTGTHNGVDFRASVGTPVKAAAGGVVAGTGNTDIACKGASYGNWVLIRHPNGLATIYGHLELIKVTTGQHVDVGDIIGYSGSTGYATGPHLHFGLYVSSAVEVVDLPSKACPGAVFHLPVAPANGYLDPLSYL